MNYPQQILRFCLNTVFPIKCISCGIFSPINRKDYLCKKCLTAIPINKTFECIGCSKTSPLGKTCFECKKDNNIDHLLIVADYKKATLEKLIKVFKYRFIGDVAESFRKLIKKYVFWLGRNKNFNLAADNPLIIPIPLYPRRLNWRGLNHAEILAQTISEIIYTEIKNDVLTRHIDVKPQADIKDREERLKNTANIFKINNSPEIKGRTIILVDDICTTGATLNEAAKLLKENGAAKVIGFVIARG